MARAKVVAKAKTSATVKKRPPIKAGSTNRGGNGGIFTRKVIAIAKQRKQNKGNKNG